MILATHVDKSGSVLVLHEGTLFSSQYIMLVKVRFGESQKYVKVAKNEEGYEDFNTFLQKGWYYFFTQL